MTASDKSPELEVDYKPPGKLLFKRIIDLSVASLILILSSLFFFLFAILIKLDSKGPVFFVQKRLGKNGRVFNCYKFRTMIHNAEETLKYSLEEQPELQKEWTSHYKIKNDRRVTRIGKFLRKNSLDELPQLFNVLKGEMSLVGPRPRALYEMEGRSKDDLFKLGLTMLPGLTGLWQVSGRNELDYRHRIVLDAVYVLTWSISGDVLMLLKTVSVVAGKKGVY
jgi:exopolysaccharide production protein ExoY